MYPYIHLIIPSQPSHVSPSHPPTHPYSPPSASSASSNRPTSSAFPLAPPHLTTPFPSTAQLPAVCHRVPLSVGRFQIPSSRPSRTTLHKLHGFSTCHAELTPKPYRAYSSRPSSTMTRTFPAPPREVSQVVVEEGEECEMAMKVMEGCVEARARRRRRVCSATGGARGVSLLAGRGEGEMGGAHRDSRSAGGTQ